MKRPVRAYMFTLAAKLGRTVEELRQTMSCREFVEWMAYEHINDEDWRAKYFANKEQEAVNNMSDEEVDAMLAGLKISKVD